MVFRVTAQAQFDRQLNYIRQQSDRIAQLNEQASSGLRLLRPSDNPSDIVQLQGVRGEESRLLSYRDNVRTATDLLNRTNDSLLVVSQGLTRARLIAAEAANGPLDPDALEALAAEVDELLDLTLSTANGQAVGRSLFAGSDTQRIPFEVTTRDTAGRPLTVAYRGSPARASAPIGPDQQVDTLYSGSRLFQRPGRDVFENLIGLRDELRNVDGLSPGQLGQALQQRLGTIQQAQNVILEGVGEASASLASLDTLENRLSDLVAYSRIRTGELESADLAEVVVTLRTQEVLFSNTLAITSRINELSLVNFLR